MKFFTREWAEGLLTDDEAANRAKDYRAHLAAVFHNLPLAAQELASEISIHDGLIRRVEVNRSSGSVLLQLLCGDQQVGYFDLDLLYTGGDVASLDTETLARLSRDRRSEALYDELDRLDASTFEHRILFYPNGEVAITFRQLTISRKPRADRSLEFLGDPYAEVSHEGT